MVYTIAERVEIVTLYFTNNEQFRLTARIFNERHPNKNLDHRYVRKLISKFRETGSVLNRKHERQKTVTNEASQIGVLGHVAMEPTSSTRQLSTTSGLSRTSVQRILKTHRFHPYKIHLSQQLNEDDPDRRLQFCEEMTERIANNPNFLYCTCFSDESTFFLNGAVNRHNCRYWSDSKPFVVREQHSQYREKLNVWAGIFGNHIVGPFFLPDNLTGEYYLNLLENYIYPQIVEIMENDDRMPENDIYFQQDGAPPHYAAPVRDFLNHHFPEHWIGRRGSIEWPPRSPDLTPLDFFLWGHLKTIVYKTEPTSLEDLRHRIVEACSEISPETLQNVRENLERRFYHCMETGGSHFEHLI